ncbi:triose-phosphate transporter family-domain-containing protein [Spinellus fusiger]|nr:triose-phosphate transporter family-domain-containing protein [Spinellus fusiger]
MSERYSVDSNGSHASHPPYHSSPDASSTQRLLAEETPLKTEQSLLKTTLTNVFWVLMWYMFATVLSVYNKWMFSAEHYNFQFPLFVTTMHMVVQSVFAGVTLLMVPSLQAKKTPTSREYIFKIFPCAMATSLDIGLSNLSLKTITLSFYTMCKSSTLAFVLMFAFAFKLEAPTAKLILIILIITTGVVLMVSDETEFVWTGFLQVMTASVCGGLRWGLTEVLLRKESMGLTNPFVSIFFLAPVQALILVVLSGGIEGYGTIFRSAFFMTFQDAMATMGIILLGGIFAFFMIMSEFFLIKRTSVVTLSVCGILKEVATIAVSSAVFGDRLTLINTVGLVITLLGICLYNWMKIRMRTVHTPQEHAMEDLSAGSHHDGDPKLFYTMVAESTPILMVDGAMTSFRDSVENSRHQNEHEGYELH